MYVSICKHGTKYTIVGTYVLIVTDVTEPPFFDKRLPKCYCKVP